jgi:O-antigen/teichoic acid export membrane protein
MGALSDDPQTRLNIAQKGFLLITLVTGSLGAVSALALYWLIGLVFGDAYKDAFLPFSWLLPGIVLWAGARIQANYLAALGKPEWNTYVAIAVLIINISGNIILIPIYGAIGAAIATSIAYGVDATAKFLLMKRSMKLPIARTQRFEG